MWKALVAWSAAIALLGAYGAANSFVTLQPEEQAILHIGDVGEVRVATDRHYTVGAAGTALSLIKRTNERGTTVYLFRAVAVGNQTLVLTPRDPGPDGCVSCVTVHYFIQVAR
jgi:hypothetical protein